jgi:retron-type reverse transcriptase
VGESSLCNEQFGFRPQHRTALQLAYIIKKVSRNFDVKKLTDAFFLDVAKAFDIVWVNGLLYKLIIFNLFLYLDKTISSYLHGRFKVSFQTATSTCRCMQAGVAQGGIISSILFSLYVHMPLSSRHVNLVLYMDDMCITTASHQPVLLVKYQETYLSDLERWLGE